MSIFFSISTRLELSVYSVSDPEWDGNGRRQQVDSAARFQTPDSSNRRSIKFKEVGKVKVVFNRQQF